MQGVFEVTGLAVLTLRKECFVCISRFHAIEFADLPTRAPDELGTTTFHALSVCFDNVLQVFA